MDKQRIEKEVLLAFNGLVDASKSLEAKRYFEYFDKEKFTGLNADGTVWHSIQELETMITQGFSMVEKVTALEFKNVKVTVISSDTAILVNEYIQSTFLKTGDIVKGAGGGTQVWVKSNNVWKLVSVSASAAGH
ncbi:nuclear transport factor 2 family protein [Colwelliaceae bacterium 6441]